MLQSGLQLQLCCNQGFVTVILKVYLTDTMLVSILFKAYAPSWLDTCPNLHPLGAELMCSSEGSTNSIYMMLIGNRYSEANCTLM